jgi:hypothetical protein
LHPSPRRTHAHPPPPSPLPPGRRGGSEGSDQRGEARPQEEGGGRGVSGLRSIIGAECKGGAPGPLRSEARKWRGARDVLHAAVVTCRCPPPFLCDCPPCRSAETVGGDLEAAWAVWDGRPAKGKGGRSPARPVHPVGSLPASSPRPWPPVIPAPSELAVRPLAARGPNGEPCRLCVRASCPTAAVAPCMPLTTQTPFF